MNQPRTVLRNNFVVTW